MMMCSAMALWLTLLLLLANRTYCLAVNNAPSKIVKVVSTKKDGGLSKTFVFSDADQGAAAADVNSKRTNRGSHNHSLSHGIKQIQAALCSTFLPSGYPIKTPAGYLSYSMWSWIQDISTQLRSVLATQRVLEGVGVGREGATALSALMNFLVRDGCGMAATLIFTSTSSSRFRSDIKRWRLFADIMVDLGISLEVAAILVPRTLFLPMISAGTMCKAICGVAAGACGGAINLHWAKGSDISDINAKFGAQHTVTGALGLIFAALFARSVSTLNQTKLWVLYSSLTLLHIIANMECMKLIAFDSFNNARMNLVVKEYLAQSSDITAVEDLQSVNTTIATKSVSLSSPKDIATVEPLFFVGTRQDKIAPLPIHFGVSLDEFSTLTGKSEVELQELLQQAHQNDSYLLSASWHGGRRPSVVVSFLAHATPEQQAKAYYHAILLSRQLKECDATNSRDVLAAETIANNELERSWNDFSQSCRRAGWDLSKTEIQSHGYELEVVR